ncbi:hypothetical protein BVRB_3g068620 [Beta vulgaris subsp. vulgaris]|nr:hypothetical protein BVRB_3g068620 [Beta vulgaris subsp. vulgaris]
MAGGEGRRDEGGEMGQRRWVMVVGRVEEKRDFS